MMTTSTTTRPKVIALLRVSGAAQAGPDRAGLPVQRDDCLTLAQAHQLDIVEWVTLEGVSGAAVLKAPEFQRLLDRLQEPGINGVVVGAFDRLFRRGRFSDYEILDAFSDTGTMLYTPQGVYDLREDSDALMGVIYSELSSAERRNIARRTRAGRERKRREKGHRAEGDGKVGMPRGVEFDHSTKEYRYVYPEAETVRQVFRLFLQGESNLAAIARATNLGLGSKGSPSWAVRSVLTQPLYMGIYRVTRRWKGGKPEARHPEDTYEHQVLDPPLIDPVDWHRAQARLAELHDARPQLPALEERPADYAGFAECARCGGLLRVLVDRRHGYWFYRCYRSDRKACDLGQLSRQKVDSATTAALERVLGDLDTLCQLIEESRRDQARTAAERPREAARRMTTLKNRRKRALDMFEAGLIEMPELRKRTEAIDAELQSLEAVAAAAEEIDIDSDAVTALVDVFSSWPHLGRAEKQRLLKAFGIRVAVDKAGQGKRSVARVARVHIGLLRDVVLYKKTKRLGIG